MHLPIFTVHRNLLPLVCAVFVIAGCNPQINVATDIALNGQRTITRLKNGVTRKLVATAGVEIQEGRITKFPKAALVKLEQNGSSGKKRAELRENGDALELWIEEKGAFRKGSTEDERWLEGFLEDIVEK